MLNTRKKGKVERPYVFKTNEADGHSDERTWRDWPRLASDPERATRTESRDCAQLAQSLYRVTHLLMDLTLNSESSPADGLQLQQPRYCPSRMVEHPKSKSTQPRSKSRWVTLLLGTANWPKGEKDNFRNRPLNSRFQNLFVDPF